MAAEGVKIRSNSSDGSTNRAEVRTEGTLATSSVVRIPVFVTMRPPLWAGPMTAIVTADHGVNQVEIAVQWQYEDLTDESQVYEALPVYGYVNTPYGRYPTSDPDLIGRYVADPVWSGAVGGSVITGNNA